MPLRNRVTPAERSCAWYTEGSWLRHALVYNALGTVPSSSFLSCRRQFQFDRGALLSHPNLERKPGEGHCTQCAAGHHVDYGDEFGPCHARGAACFSHWRGSAARNLLSIAPLCGTESPLSPRSFPALAAAAREASDDAVRADETAADCEAEGEALTATCLLLCSSSSSTHRRSSPR